MSLGMKNVILYVSEPIRGWIVIALAFLRTKKDTILRTESMPLKQALMEARRIARVHKLRKHRKESAFGVESWSSL